MSIESFLPNTSREIEEMLTEIGVNSFDDLVRDIPKEVRLDGPPYNDQPLSELEVRDVLEELARKNASCSDWICFMGGGAYDHFIPAVVDEIASRSEFYTAYTPYQPEISQGTLQTIYEFQTMIAELTGMEVANASLYDGGAAVAEGVLMASSITGRHKVIVSGCVNPLRLAVLRAYLRASGLKIQVTKVVEGVTSHEEVAQALDDQTACVVVENPNFFGVVEDCSGLEGMIHSSGALFIVSADPISLGLISPPEEYGADIVVGEGQVLGNPLSFGGPYLGYLATRKKYIRKIPGRIVGKTVDVNGNTCFCLTLQTREQHIRRERATSNICTNEALNALRATIYLSWLGRRGVRELCERCLSKAYYASRRFQEEGLSLVFDKPFFREFAIDLGMSARIVFENLLSKKILCGVPLGWFYPQFENCLLVAFTEKRKKSEIDLLVEEIGKQVKARSTE